MYEAPESGKSLDSETFVSVRVQLAMAYNYMGDHPKAIADPGLRSCHARPSPLGGEG